MNSVIQWPLPPAQWSAEQSGIDVWAFPLDADLATLSLCRRLLSNVELECAGQFASPIDQKRFIVGHGRLRQILGHYVQSSPAALEFRLGHRDKPALAPGVGNVEFNLAHSRDLGVLAVSRAGPVGIDIESIEPVDDMAGIVRRFFSRRERAQFEALSEDRKIEAFFNLWTRKEACLKATGEGIGESLDKVEVAFLPGEPARLLTANGEPDPAPPWTLFDLAAAPGYAAALASLPGAPAPVCWRWPDS